MHKELFLRLQELAGREQDKEIRVGKDLLPNFESPSEPF
jgi:hypothetical protein